jgi:acetyl esterase/lipase
MSMRTQSVRRWAITIVSLSLAFGGTAPAADDPPAPAQTKKAQKGKGQAARIPPGIKAMRDLEYVPGGGKSRSLDLYVPEKTPDHPLPLIVWIHGGGWRQGTKTGGPFFPLLSQGYACASVEYRLTDEAKFPAQIYDCKAAIRYLRSHAKEHGIDGDHIGVWGGSAGGHLVALLGTSGDVKDVEGDEGVTGVSSRVQAVCDWFGPSDFLSFHRGPTNIKKDAADSPFSQLFGGTLEEKHDLAVQASPVTFVSKDDPPFLIMHGDKDPLVPLAQSRELEEMLRKAGVDTKLIVLEGAPHGGPMFQTPDSINTVRAFFDRTLKGVEAKSIGGQ